MNYYFLFKSLHLISVYLGWRAFCIYQEFLFIILKHTMSHKKIFLKSWKKTLQLHHDACNVIVLVIWNFIIHSITLSVLFELWMQIKIIAVIILTYYHFTLGKYLNDFAIDKNEKTSKFFRIYNEIPTIVLIVVILL